MNVVLTPGTNVCVSNLTATSSTITLTRNAYLTPSVTATVDDTTAFPGQTLTFTATPTNGGSGATYQWFVDGSVVNGQSAATYVTNGLSVGAHTVYAVLTPSGGNNCYSPTTATSNNVTLTVDGSACTGTPNTGTTNATTTNVCNGSSTTLSLTGLGTTTNISYNWQTSTTQGGTYTSVGVTTATFTPTNITSALWYRCNVTCDNSNSSTPSTPIQITVTANQTPSVSIGSTTTVCAGTSVTLTATPTFGGATPTYSWYKVGTASPVQTGASATYTSLSINDGDQFYVVMTSNYACVTSATATSNTVTQNMTANVAASVSIANPVNPSCAGTSITFTATPTNGGATPTYQWYNGASPM